MHPNERTKGSYFLENYAPLADAGGVVPCAAAPVAGIDTSTPTSAPTATATVLVAA